MGVGCGWRWRGEEQRSRTTFESNHKGKVGTEQQPRNGPQSMLHKNIGPEKTLPATKRGKGKLKSISNQPWQINTWSAMGRFQRMAQRTSTQRRYSTKIKFSKRKERNCTVKTTLWLQNSSLLFHRYQQQFSLISLISLPEDINLLKFSQTDSEMINIKSQAA